LSLREARLKESAISDDDTSPTVEKMKDFEARAEAAYAAMYEARSYEEKDFKDDACSFLARAAEIADALGRDADAARLRARTDQIMSVYNSQFRYIGR